MGGWSGVENLPPEGLWYLAGTNCPASSQLSFPRSSGLGADWLCFLKSMNLLAWKSFLVPVEIRAVCRCPCLKLTLANWSVMVKFVRDVGNIIGLMFSLENWEFYTISFFFFLKKLFSWDAQNIQVFFFPLCSLKYLNVCSFLNIFGYVYTS